MSLVERSFHRVCNSIGVEDRFSTRISRRTTDGLDQTLLGTEKTFLVRIEHCHERHFRQIEPLTQQVDPNQHVKLAAPQIAKNLDPFESFDVRVQITNAHTNFSKILRQIFSHPL